MTNERWRQKIYTHSVWSVHLYRQEVSRGGILFEGFNLNFIGKNLENKYQESLTNSCSTLPVYFSALIDILDMANDCHSDVEYWLDSDLIPRLLTILKILKTFCIMWLSGPEKFSKNQTEECGHKT